MSTRGSGKPGKAKIFACVSEAFTRTYWPCALPPAHAFVQLPTVIPLVPGQPQKEVGAGVAVIPAVLVALTTAFWMPVRSVGCCDA